MCSSDQFLAQQTESHPRSQTPDTYSAFISIPYVQGVSEPIESFGLSRHWSGFETTLYVANLRIK